jgi:hypothetical protein
LSIRRDGSLTTGSQEFPSPADSPVSKTIKEVPVSISASLEEMLEDAELDAVGAVYASLARNLAAALDDENTAVYTRANLHRQLRDTLIVLRHQARSY